LLAHARKENEKGQMARTLLCTLFAALVCTCLKKKKRKKRRWNAHHRASTLPLSLAQALKRENNA